MRTSLLRASRFVLDISFPIYDSYLHAAYIDSGGRVDPVIPGDQQLWPDHAPTFVEETSHEIGQSRDADRGECGAGAHRAA